MKKINSKVLLRLNDNLLNKLQARKEVDFERAKDPANFDEFAGVSFTDAGYIKHLLWGVLKND